MNKVKLFGLLMTGMGSQLTRCIVLAGDMWYWTHCMFPGFRGDTDAFIATPGKIYYRKRSYEQD